MIKCDCCGSYEPECAVCKRLFDHNKVIICDDEIYDSKATKKHYHLSCYQKTKASKKVNS